MIRWKLLGIVSKLLIWDRANFNDVFNTMLFQFDGQRPYIQNGAFNWESQTLYLGLQYRFGSGKNRAKGRKRRDDNTKKSGGGIL